MPIGQVNYEQQYVLRNAAGAIVWQGGGIGGCMYRVVSGEASTTIAAGGAVIIDTTDANTTLGRDANLATSDADVNRVSVLQVVSAASVGFIGVSAQPILAAGLGNVMGAGTICAVRVTSGAIALGANIGGSATAGLCASIAVGTTAGIHLGVCVKAAAQIGSSGLYTAGVLVSPY